ncbi:MAG: DUF5011 domain-containing protein [Chitinispirillaceae bacterium]|nr:DUF5011 domain-containing protein [Chitinispirillaceae bacterium]
MKKTLLTMLAASFSLFVSQCSENPASSEHQITGKSESIKIAIAIPKGLDTAISEAYVEISGDSMRTIRQQLYINYSSIYGVIENVPAGFNRHFEVFVYGTSGKKLMYYGDSYANIYAGQETYIKIILRQPGGTAIIEGYIEGYQPPSDTIPVPSTPYIYNYKLTSSNPPRCRELTFATDGSVYPDSLYYEWSVFRNNNRALYDSSYRRGHILTLEYPQDGFYSVFVRARRMYGDTAAKSYYSDSLCFSIRNGLLIDTVITPPSDTIPTPSVPYIYGYKLTQTNPPRCYALSLATDGSAYRDSLYYYWEVFRTVDMDTIYNSYLLGQLLTIEYPKDGFYQVRLRARRMYGDTTIMSSPSYFQFTIKSGLLADTITTPDTDFPVLTLKGPDTVIIPLYGPYHEFGATAYDSTEGDLTDSIHISGFHDSTVAGVYSVTYTVSDKAGHTVSKTRIIIYTTTQSIDTVPPVIKLKGPLEISYTNDSLFQEPGYTAIDNLDGDITSKVSITMQQFEDFAIRQYSVSDAAGNKASAYRTINYHSIPLSVISRNPE